jgi:hypothetical protein
MAIVHNPDVLSAMAYFITAQLALQEQPYPKGLEGSAWHSASAMTHFDPLRHLEVMT